MQSLELQELVREHARRLDGSAAPVLFEELTGPNQPAIASQRRSLAEKYRGLAYALAAAVTLLILIGGAAFLFNGSIEPVTAPGPLATAATISTSIPESPDVFDLATDTLCDRFSADEMNQIVATAQERAGTAFDLGGFEGNCWAYRENRFSAWGSAGWQENPASEGSIMIGMNLPRTDSVVKFDPGRLMGHDMLNAAVTYHLVRYYVAYDAGFRAYLQVDGHEDILDFAFGVGGSGGGTPKYEDLGLAIANELLIQMNWIESD